MKKQFNGRKVCANCGRPFRPEHLDKNTFPRGYRKICTGCSKLTKDCDCQPLPISIPVAKPLNAVFSKSRPH